MLAEVGAALGLGLALAGAPGPVQAVLFTEAVRGGVGRGFRALAGSSVTFGVLLICLALGLSVTPPTGSALRVLKIVGGVFLLWMAADAFRSGHRVETAERRTLPPAARGVLAILLNPGAWLFLGAVVTPLFASATRRSGTGSALLAAAALLGGAALGDSAVVLAGGLGARGAGGHVGLWARRILAAVLAALGGWLIAGGVAW